MNEASWFQARRPEDLIKMISRRGNKANRARQLRACRLQLL